KHGFQYLKNVMWDHEYGGWFRLLDASGTALESGSKHSHGSAYALGACTAYYKLTADPDALALATQTFAWLDNSAHDAVHGGYFGLCRQNGNPILSAKENPDGGHKDHVGCPIGLKDSNTNGDMLEAIADLYWVFSDVLLETRLREMFCLLRDRMFVPPG